MMQRAFVFLLVPGDRTAGSVEIKVEAKTDLGAMNRAERIARSQHGYSPRRGDTLTQRYSLSVQAAEVRSDLAGEIVRDDALRSGRAKRAEKFATTPYASVLGRDRR
jgi:hypothetical protein